MIHRGKQLLCVLLSLVLSLQLVQPALAYWPDSSSAPATSEDVVLTDAEGNRTKPDKSWEETYPYGAFAFDTTAADVKEGEDTVVTVYRLGGTNGRATAYVAYSPLLVPNEDGSIYYGYGLSGKDLTIEVEDELPIAQYQPVGKPADPEPGAARVLKSTDELGYVLTLSQEADSYQWEIYYDGGWRAITDSDHQTLEMDAEYLDYGQDYRCVYTVDGTRYCTDSLAGDVYEKPAPEELAPMPDDVELNPDPTYSPVDIDDESDPYSGWIFSLTFAEGEWAKEIHFHANTDKAAEAMEAATLRIAYTDGGEICPGSETLLYHVEDLNESTPSTLGFSVTAVSADKASGTAEIMIKRAGGFERPVSVEYQTVDGKAKAGTDYVAASGTLMFYGNVTELPVKVELIDDQRKSDEPLDFSVKLSALKGDDNCKLAADTATVTLTNSGKGDGANLASQLRDGEAADLTGAVKDSPTSANSGSRPAVGEQVKTEKKEAVPLELVPEGSTGELSLQSHDFGSKALIMFITPGADMNPSGWSDSASFGSTNAELNYKGDFTVDGGGYLFTGHDADQDELNPIYNNVDYMPPAFYSKDSIYFCNFRDYDPTATLSDTVMNANNSTEAAFEKKYAAQMFESYSFNTDGMWLANYAPRATITVNTGGDDSETYNVPGQDFSWGQGSFNKASGSQTPFIRMTGDYLNKALGGIDLKFKLISDDGWSMIHTSGTLYNRRAFQENAFYVDITTPNDADNTEEGMAVISDYDAYYPIVTLEKGSVKNNGTVLSNRICVGSTIKFTPNPALAGMYVSQVSVFSSTDEGKTWEPFEKFRIAGRSADDGGLMIKLVGGTVEKPFLGNQDGYNGYDLLTLNDINNTIYKFRVVYGREAKISVDLRPSLPRDGNGNPDLSQINQLFNDYNGNEDHCFGDAGIRLGDSRYDWGIPYEYSHTSWDNPVAPRDAGSVSNGVWSFRNTQRNVQWINFGLDPSDLLLLNGRFYAGDETIYLTEEDLTGDLNFLYYHSSYKGEINAMTTTPVWTALYLDADGNGKIDGTFDDNGNFILEKDNSGSTKDVFIQYLKGGESLNELELAPSKLLGQDKYAQYFIQYCYTMTPRSLTVPAGEDPNGKAQVLAAFTSAINPDSAAYASLTEEQRQYTYVVSGKDKNGNYTSDNHPMYGKEANKKSLLSIPLGGDKHPPELVGDKFVWTPDWFQNQLYTYEHPDLVTITNSVAGETPVTTGYTVNGETKEYDYTPEGLKQINGYLASLTGTSTYLVVSRMQEYTTHQILNGPMSLQDDGNKGNGKPDSVTMGFLKSAPDGTYLAYTNGSNPSPKPEVIDTNGGEPEKNELPEFGNKFDLLLGDNEIGVTDYFTVLVSDNEVGFVINVPIVEGEKKHRNESMERKFFTPFTDADAWTQFGKFWGRGNYGKDDSLHDAFEKKNSGTQDKFINSGKFSAKLAIQTAFLWRYNPLDNGYYFCRWELGLAGELAFRAQARLTVCPLLYGYFSVQFSLELKSGLGVIRDATDGVAEIDGKRPGCEANAKELAHYATGYTGKKATPEFLEFDLATKAFNVRFDGKLYVQVLVKDGNGWKVADKDSGFVSGLIASNGSNDTLVTIRQQDGMRLAEPVKVRLFAVNHNSMDLVDITKVSYLAPVVDIYNLVHWNGINVAPELAIEVGVGVGVELMKLEAYIHFSIGAEFTFCSFKSTFDPDIHPHDYAHMYDDAAVDSFNVTIGLGIRAVFLMLTYELDLVSYQVNYEDGEWEYGWHFLNDMVQPERADNPDEGVTVRLPENTADDQKLYSPLDNARGELLTQAFHPNDENVPFQLSNYGSAKDAANLSTTIPAGSQYKVLRVGDETYLAYTISRTAPAPEDSTMLVLSKLAYSDRTKTYGLVNPTGALSPVYIPVDVEDEATGDLDFDIWADGTGAIHAAWVSYASPAEVTKPEKPSGDVYTIGGTAMTADNYNTIPAPAEVTEPSADAYYTTVAPADETGWTRVSDNGRDTWYKSGDGGYASLDAAKTAYSQALTAYNTYTEQLDSYTEWNAYYAGLDSYNAGLQARAKAAAENTVVKTASWSQDKESFTAPETVSGETGSFVFLPGAEGNDSAVFFGSTAAKDTGNAAYRAYTDYQATKDLPAQIINYLNTTKRATLDMLGTQSALNLAVKGESGWQIYQTALQEGQTLANVEFTKLDNGYCVAYTTEQTAYENGDMVTVYRLYLRSVTVQEDGTADWGQPCLIRELRDFDQDKGGADGVYSGGALMAGKECSGPYLSNLRFLNAQLDSEILTGGEELSLQAVERQTLLVFEMNGASYIIPQATLESIVTGGGGMIYPFFTPPMHDNADGTQAQEDASGKLQVDINADDAGNLYAVYVGNVSGCPGNALFLSAYDARVNSWGDGVVLAMRDMDTSEAAVRNGWDTPTAELAYLYGDKDIRAQEDALTAMYGKEALDRVKAASPGDLGDGKRFSFGEIQTVQGDKGELLVVTQGSLQTLEVRDYPDGGSTEYTLVPTYTNGAMDASLGTYAVSFSQGAQKLGNGTIAFGKMDFSAGTELYVDLSATNVGTTAFRGSEDHAIKATLTAGGQHLATWDIKENVVSGQEIELDGYCDPLTTALENGNAFVLTLTEDSGEGYTGTSQSLPLFTVEDKPDLSVENLSIRPDALTDDGENTVMDVEFAAINQGTADAANVYAQFTYEDENGDTRVLPLTGNTLTVDKAQGISQVLATQSAAASNPGAGILALQGEDGSNIPVGQGRRVSGTITVPSTAFCAGESGYANISVQLFSDADSVLENNAGVITARHGEYYGANNLASQSVEAFTEITAAHSVVIPLGATTKLPISAVSSRGTSPVLTVQEIDDSSDGLNIGIQNFKKSGGKNGTADGVLSLTPAAEGSGTLHVTDSETSSTFSVAFEVTSNSKGIDIFNDNGTFTFQNAGTAWKFQTIPSWGEDANAEAPLRNNLSVGSKNASFTFDTVAESIDLYFQGSISVKVGSGEAKEYTNPDGGKTYTTIPLGENPDNLSRTVKVTVLSDQTKFDRLVESYTGNKVPIPAYDGVSPYFIWSRSFPDTGSVKTGQAVPLKLYALDNGAIDSLTVNTVQYTDPAAPNDPVTSDDGRIWCYDFRNTITDNGSYTITARDNAGNQTTVTLQVDWFLQTPVGDANTVLVPRYTSDFYLGDSDAPIDGDTPLGGDAAPVIKFASADGNTKQENNTHEVYYFDGSGFQAVTDREGSFPVTANGLYWARTVNGDGTWSAQVLSMNLLDSSVPQATLGYSSTTGELVWTAAKSSRADSVAPITTVTINGRKVNDTEGTSLSGGMPITYGGLYTLEVTDRAGQSASLTYKAVLPLTGEKVTAAPSWNQAGSNGSVTLDVGNMTGESYGSDSAPETGRYTRGVYEAALLPDGGDPADDGLTWTALPQGTTTTHTWEGLAPGTYTVVIRDQADPDNSATAQAQVENKALTASAVTRNASAPNVSDGKMVITTKGGMTDQAEFAVLPASRVPAETDILDYLRDKDNQVAWRLGDSNKAYTADGLAAGDYYVAARTVYADLSSLTLGILKAALDAALTGLENARAALEADPDNPDLQAALTDAQGRADTAKTAYDNALQSAAASSEAQYDSNPAYWDGVFVFDGTVTVAADPDKPDDPDDPDDPHGPGGPSRPHSKDDTEEIVTSNLQDISADKNGTVVFTLKPGEKLTAQDQEKVRTSNADNDILLVADGVSVLVPEDTLFSPYFDPNRLLADTGLAGEGMVVKYTNLKGETKVAVFGVVNDGKAKYLAMEEGDYRAASAQASFSDIAGRWGEADILFAACRGLVTGTGDGMFSPDVTMSRAMFVTVLWRMFDSPAPAGEASFRDLDADWYRQSVAWAVENGIVSGYTETEFGPNDPVTREQMCALMLRCLDYMGRTLDKVNPAVDFADADQISEWAADAVDTCVRMGLINGVGLGMVAPLQNATRMEASAILTRFVKAIVAQYCG